MKLKKVTIEGFRGAPKLLELPLDGKNLCLLGENGRGKTTIVDALEYWSAGKLENFGGEGYGLDATINLNHGGPATITCERQGHATLRRKLAGAKAEDLEVVGPTTLDSSLPPPLPILRHGTMARFMAKTRGEKKRALLGVLGFEALQDFRDTLVKAVNAAKSAAEEAEARAGEELLALRTQCAGVGVVGRAEALRKDAGLTKPISTEAELLELDFATTPAVEARVSRAELVANVARGAETIETQSITDWNELSANREALEAAALHALVTAGQNVLKSWDEGTCPLCLSVHDTSALGIALIERAASLASLDQKLRSARTGLDSHREIAAALADGVTTLLDSPPKGGWPHADALKEIAEKLQHHAQTAATALSDGKACPPLADGIGLDEILPSLRLAAVSDEASPTVAAFAQLEGLRIALKRSEEFRRKAEAKRKVADAADGLRELTEEQVRTAVESAISRLGAVAADFYGRLVKNPVYSGAKLKYTEGRSGGIEFTLTFDKRHEVSPPQRVVSDSQLNALGLAFFLARLKVEDTPWRTLVLDDVVNSFDADHRMGLAHLLAEEFGDWQVVFFTHDNMFATLIAEVFSGWRFWQIVAWNPKEGPVLSEGDPLKRLKDRLDAGEAAIDLGSLARFALERGLSRPLERLGLPIRFDRRSRYSAREYLDALQKGLADRGSSLQDLSVLNRMRGESYLVNVAAHDRQADPSLSTEDLRQMVADLEELNTNFTCSDCGRPVWEMQKGVGSFQCKCSKLSV